MRTLVQSYSQGFYWIRHIVHTICIIFKFFNTYFMKSPMLIRTTKSCDHSLMSKPGSQLQNSKKWGWGLYFLFFPPCLHQSIESTKPKPCFGSYPNLRCSVVYDGTSLCYCSLPFVSSDAGMSHPTPLVNTTAGAVSHQPTERTFQLTYLLTALIRTCVSKTGRDLWYESGN